MPEKFHNGLACADYDALVIQAAICLGVVPDGDLGQWKNVRAEAAEAALAEAQQRIEQLEDQIRDTCATKRD